MDQGPVLQQSLPIHEYSNLPSEPDYNDQFPNHAHGHPSYTPSGGTVNQIRHDGSAVQPPPPTPFSFLAANHGANGARYDRAVASDTSSYPASANFTDSSSGSIETSPSSAASSLYSNYPPHHCTNVPSFPGTVQLPQAFVTGALPAPYASSRVPTLDTTASGMLPPPTSNRSPISSSTNATDREAYANSTPFVGRTQLSSGFPGGFGSYSDTPRQLSLHSLSLSNASSHYGAGHGAHMASPGYNTIPNESSSFPWPNLEIHADMTCENQAVTPEVHAKVEKGFFQAPVDKKWTCYRRNYFSVQCNFELHPNINNGRMFLKRNNSTTAEPIQAMGMRLSAAVDGSGGKAIELIQHTPKRDNGPKNKIEVVRVSPMPPSGRADHTVSPHGIYAVPMSSFHATGQVAGPYLPLQYNAEPNATGAIAQPSQVPSSYPYSASASHLPVPGPSTSHTFERIQFKQATANNGKRRASQQYFHLIVELFADVRKESSDTPQWVKVAHRVSDKIVVRGRSPSHYGNEGQNQNGRAGSSGGSGSSSYNPGGGGGGGGGYGSLATGSFRGSSSSYGGLSHGGYRPTTYGIHPSPERSGSSASSVDGGVTDIDYSNEAVMSDAERNEIQGHEGYRYYPAPIYEGVPPGALPLPKIETTARFSTDPSGWAIKSEYHDAMPGAQWPVAGLGRFHGVESSRGYYPELHSNYS